MGWMRWLRRGFWYAERTRELDAYLDQETGDNIARGMTPVEARTAAQRRLGNVTVIHEEIYRNSGFEMVAIERGSLSERVAAIKAAI